MTTAGARLAGVARLLPGREVTTFLVVGGAGYVVDVLAFNWLRGHTGLAGADPTAAKVLAVAAAMVVTYLGNRLLTWRDRASDGGREVALFIVFNLVGLAISVGALVVSHDLLGLTSRLADNISANVVGLGLGTAFRFWTYRRFVFTEEPVAILPGGLDAPPRSLLTVGESLTVDIISGSYGAGHDAAAHEIATRLAAGGHVVRRWDIVDLFPLGLGRLLRRAYFAQLRTVPGSWGLLLRRLEPGSLAHRIATGIVSLPAHRVRTCVSGSDLVISTHPFASQALGRLRAAGRLDTPVVTYLTDASVHALWVHPGVDLHLALHEVTAAQARGLGGTTSLVEPLLPEACTRPATETTAQLRRRLGLPGDTDLALVVGGSLGVGELEQTALDIAATGLARPVVVCGTNEVLRRRLDTQPGVVALGWRTDMPDLIRASDCVVQNAGGFTSLEALAAGVPLLSYRCLPGHGETNAAALEAAGLVPWARDQEDLPGLLARAVLGTDRHPLGPSSAPDLVAALSHVFAPSAVLEAGR